MTTLREAAQQFVADYDSGGCGHFAAYAKNFRTLLAQPEPRRTGLPHCERSCEANAFQIEIRRLKAELAAEREACADICDQHASVEGIAQRCAEQIRARSKT
jgi:hypothetical protein